MAKRSNDPAALRAEEQRITAAIQAKRAERQHVENALLPRAEAQENVQRFVRSRAERWDRPLNGLARPGGGLLGLVLPDPRTGQGFEHQAEALLCAVIPDAIEAELTRRLDELYATADGEGLPAAERPVRLAELDAEIRELEEKREDLIERAEAAGIAIDRRADADPSVVLGLPPRERAA